MSEEIDLNTIEKSLKTWLERKMPRAEELSLLLDKDVIGGSNETFFLELRYQESGEKKHEKLVIRWPPSGFTTFLEYDMKKQFLIFKNLGRTAVPVPGARWLEEDESVIGRPFYIVDRIEGWIPGIHPPYQIAGPIFDGPPEFRTGIWLNALDTMATINTIDWKQTGFDFLDVPFGGTGPIDQHIGYYEELFGMTEGSHPPVLELTMNWLKENSFVPKHVSLCWGDSRLGNLIYLNDEVAGVLDWEMACLGDSESDLAWFIHMDLNQQNLLGKGNERLEGLPGTEETIEYYEKVTNRRVENFFYHEVFATWRVAVICLRLQKVLKMMGRPMPDMDINQYNYDRLRSLLEL